MGSSPVSRCKLSKRDFAAMNKLVAGVRYPPGNQPAQLKTARKPPRQPKGRSSS